MKKTTIFISAVSAFVLATTLFGYFQFFGPISVNLKSENIERIGFIHPEGGEEYETFYIDPIKKEPLLEELRDIKFRKTFLKCRCMGDAFVVIEYQDESKVKFDGFYLKKTDTQGKVTSYALRRFDHVVAQLYQDYMIE